MMNPGLNSYESESAQVAHTTLSNQIFRKITLRFIPLLFVCYVLNYMDRTNIGFAQLQMRADLGLSDVAYGFGAGMFFVSYSLFALPSNLLLTKIGARRTIFGSLFGWGLTSSATMLIHTPMQFYALRFLLGVVEAGFFPGIIYYFGEWYPSDRRAKVIGIFTSATVVAGIVSGLMSGGIMTYLDGFSGLRGWQWMFLIEGLPSAAMGIAVFFYLDDGPEEAKWLSDWEKRKLLALLEGDAASSQTSRTLRKALSDWHVYLLGLIYFLAVFDTFVLAFWQPEMIQSFGVSSSDYAQDPSKGGHHLQLCGERSSISPAIFRGWMGRPAVSVMRGATQTQQECAVCVARIQARTGGRSYRAFDAPGSRGTARS